MVLGSVQIPTYLTCAPAVYPFLPPSLSLLLVCPRRNRRLLLPCCCLRFLTDRCPSNILGARPRRARAKPLARKNQNSKKEKKNIVPTILARRSFSHPPKKRYEETNFTTLLLLLLDPVSPVSNWVSYFSSSSFFSLFPSSSFLIESRQKKEPRDRTNEKKQEPNVHPHSSLTFILPFLPRKKGKPQKVSHQKRLFLFFLLEQKATRVGETCDCFISFRGFVLVLGLARLTRAIPVIFLLGICRCSTITSQTLTCQGKNKTPPRPSF